jgi:hypothetical protein
MGVFKVTHEVMCITTLFSRLKKRSKPALALALPAGIVRGLP